MSLIIVASSAPVGEVLYTNPGAGKESPGAVRWRHPVIIDRLKNGFDAKY
jgi:hypothetical protein